MKLLVIACPQGISLADGITMLILKFKGRGYFFSDGPSPAGAVIRGVFSANFGK